MGYTKEQVTFLMKKYGEAFFRARDKKRVIESLGEEAYNGVKLKPEYELTVDEKAALHMLEEYYEQIEELEKSKGL